MEPSACTVYTDRMYRMQATSIYWSVVTVFAAVVALGAVAVTAYVDIAEDYEASFARAAQASLLDSSR